MVVPQGVELRLRWFLNASNIPTQSGRSALPVSLVPKLPFPPLRRRRKAQRQQLIGLPSNASYVPDKLTCHISILVSETPSSVKSAKNMCMNKWVCYRVSNQRRRRHHIIIAKRSIVIRILRAGKLCDNRFLVSFRYNAVLAPRFPSRAGTVSLR